MKNPGLVFLSVVLMIIAIAGIGAGVWMIIKAVAYAGESRENGGGALMLISLALLPVLVGTVALAGVANVLAVDGAREEQLAVLLQIREQLSYAIAPSPPTDPALAAKRAREAEKDAARVEIYGGRRDK
jgi:hypothetical protein